MNGDLISRSALLGGYDVRKVTEYDESGCGLEYKAVSVEAIEAAPAVDAEPVRHARYGFIGMDMMAGSRAFYFGTCSACQERINFESKHKNYCPNCGAKMRGNESASE